MTQLLELTYGILFGCLHPNTTWPLTTDKGTHVSCLDCGKTIPYDFEKMQRRSN